MHHQLCIFPPLGGTAWLLRIVTPTGSSGQVGFLLRGLLGSDGSGMPSPQPYTNVQEQRNHEQERAGNDSGCDHHWYDDVVGRATATVDGVARLPDVGVGLDVQ